MTEMGEKREKKEEIVTWLVAAAAFGAFLLISAFWTRAEHGGAPTPGRVLFGDSIYVEWDEDSVLKRLEEKTGEAVWDAAMGGTSLARADGERRMDLAMDSLSMAALSKAMISGDFSVQRQARIRVAATEYFDDVIGEVSAFRFQDVEILFLGYGMNDYQNGVPLYSEGDAWDEYSFSGALRSVLAGLSARYPDMRIILLTPTYSWYVSRGKTCEELDFGGGILEDYVQCEQEIASQFQVETVDLYHGLYEKGQFEDWELYTSDGVHPNERGREMIAGRIAEYLEEHP